MKKNISINLQGIIFHLEDDGYEVLSRYLHEVKAHFASYQGHEEIVADIEGRIAELFSARLSVNKQVITLLDVEEMTAKMGRVSDFAAEPDEEDQEPVPGGAAGAGSAFAGGPAPSPAADTEPRRLYRDLAHRKVAGVCAGLAQYFRVNPLLVRLIFLALVLLPGIVTGFEHFPGIGIVRHHFDLGSLAFIAYGVLWVALPKRLDAPAPIETLDFGGKLTGRKLFRDTDTGKVGGVAAGLAAYFRTDVVLVRVLFLLSLFLGGSGLVIYLILWAVVPEARTVSEKMQMRGDAVTLSGIDNNLRSSAFDADGNPSPNRPLGTYLESAARNARPAVDFVGTLIRWVAAGILVFMGASSLLSVLGFAGAALGIISSDSVIHSGTADDFRFGDESFNSVVRNVQPWGIVAATLAAGIPALALLFLGVRLVLRRSVLGRTGGLVLLALWLLGVVGTAVGVMQIVGETRTRATYATTRRLAPVPGPGIVLDSRDMDDFMEDARLNLALADSGAAPYIEEEYQARGRTQNSARLTAQQSILYNITQQDSTITFDQGLTLRENAPYRGQKLTLTLHLPLDKTYRLMPNFIDRLDDEDFTSGRRPSTDAPHRARLTRDSKFTCLDCPPSDDDADGRASRNDDSEDEVVDLGVNGNKMQLRVNTDGDEPKVSIRTQAAKFSTDLGTYGTGRKRLNDPSGFTEVEVHGALRVAVRQGSSYQVEAAGRTEDLDELRLDTSGDRLVVRQRGSFLSGFAGSKHPILVVITMPQLDQLKLSGACQSDVSGFSEANLALDISGASTARLDVRVPRLELDMSGACSAELSGSADDLRIDGTGVCQVSGLNLQTQRATIDLGGMSQARVRTSEQLTVDLSGSSSVRYAGRPGRIEKDLSGSSSLEQVKE
jgi:phage shock protein PspC (stress-responsive transcriptional regulator)